MIQRCTRSNRLFPALPMIAGVAIVLASTPAWAQSRACAPPKSGEYLLLVKSQTPETQARVRNLLSRDSSVTVCRYLEDVVTRVGGFRDSDTASSWANYLNDTVGLQAFVVRPSNRQTEAQNREQFSTRATTTLRSRTGGYNPQQLGNGFAVIVNYNNRPEVASQVQQALDRDIGLASYRQRPYLLAVHTSNRSIANAVLQRLSDRGFSATIVDSRRVILLTPVVSLPQAVGAQ